MSPQNYRHEFYQNDEFVVVTIFARGCNKEQVHVQYRPDSVIVKVQDQDYELNLAPLAHEIVPQECFHQVYSTKIEIKLKKVQTGVKWNVLEGQDDVTQMARPSYPTSSKKTVNWDAIVPEDEKPEGDAAVNALFQKIYADGSDDVKKAMMKSFQESGGTTLSTNWEEISKEKTPIRPPDGVEVREMK